MHIGKPPEPYLSDAPARSAPAGFARPLAVYLVIAAAVLTLHGATSAYGISPFGNRSASLLTVAGP